MKNILIDAGPLIALFDKRDKYHSSILSFLPQIKDRLITTWPVIAEVCHMLSFSVSCQLDFLTWCERGGLKIEGIAETDMKRLIALTRKYDNVPMDLADATLMILSERLEIPEIISIDEKEMVRNVFQVSK